MANNELTGKTVWVTGSARRVGRVIALDLARHGADIVVHCNRSRDEAEETAADIARLGRKAIIVQGDHGNRAAVERMVEQIGSAFAGGLYGLVNSAAAFPRKKFEDTTDGDFDRVIGANLRGPFLCSQLALPLLRRNDPAHIVNIVDCMLPRPYANFSAYWCAKGGLDALTRALANELRPAIRVNAVSPGPVLEPEGDGPEIREKILERTFAARWGTPEDVAQTVRFLLQGDFLTGVTIPVDGGRSLG